MKKLFHYPKQRSAGRRRYPFAILADLLHWSPVVVFALSAIAIIPLRGYIGAATEVLTACARGPRIGGLLNATLGRCS